MISNSLKLLYAVKCSDLPRLGTKNNKPVTIKVLIAIAFNFNALMNSIRLQNHA